MPAFWSDPEQLYPPIPRKEEISEKNAQTVEKALFAIRSEQRYKTK
ncbi:Acetoin utilization protein AcuC [Bacillus velezensis]